MENNRKQDFISEIYAKYYETRDLDKVFTFVANKIQNWLGVRKCFLAIINKDDSHAENFVITSKEHELRDYGGNYYKTNKEKFEKFIKDFLRRNIFSRKAILEGEEVNKYGFDAENLLIHRFGIKYEWAILAADSASTSRLEDLIENSSLLEQIEEAMEEIIGRAKAYTPVNTDSLSMNYRDKKSENIMVNMPFNIIILDAEKNVTYYSERFHQEFKHCQKDMFKKVWCKTCNYFSGIFAEYIDQALEGKKSTGVSSLSNSQETVLAKQHYKWQVSPMFQNEKIIGVFLIIEDISSNIKREKLLEIYIRKLEKYNRELENFSRICAHDLKEPLRSIYSLTYLIKKENEGNLSKNSDNYMKLILNSTLTLQKLIEKLENYARDTSKFVNFEIISLGKIILEVEVLLSKKIEQNNAVINYKSLGKIHGDKVMITQLFQNLIDNAIKYRSDKDPVITISRKQSEGNILIMVQDNGIGLEKEYSTKVFDFFSRFSTNTDGEGLGLALCKRIMNRHHGEIWLKSDGKNGVCIYLLFRDVLF